MKVFRRSEADREHVDPANFSGPGWLERVGTRDEVPEIRLFRVHFEAGSRTNWHVHTGPQLLHVVEGRCRVQKQGGPVEMLEAGDVALIEPGEVHWHGAAPDGPMTHLAVNVAATTTWMEAVVD